MMIFDHFPSIELATAFALYVRDTFHRNCRVCQSQEESNRIDPFPFVLSGHIVLIDRQFQSVCGVEIDPLEAALTMIASQYLGVFAGT